MTLYKLIYQSRRGLERRSFPPSRYIHKIDSALIAAADRVSARIAEMMAMHRRDASDARRGETHIDRTANLAS